MSRAVRFERYGAPEVLDVVEVQAPAPAEDQVLLRVRAAGLNPFESKLRRGLFEGQIPVSFPAPQGTDVAGVVERVGEAVQTLAPGDEVFGASAGRGSQAELALADPSQLLRRAPQLDWAVAGSLWTVASTAVATVEAVGVQAGECVVVAGAAGGVGCLSAQLAAHQGASVIGVASERNHAWLRSLGVVPVAHGPGLDGRLREAAAGAGARPAAMIDTVGGGYVELALALGIAPERIDTIADFEAARKHGAKAEGQSALSDIPAAVGRVASLITAGAVVLPVAASFALERVREAYELLEAGHPPGKIVLLP
jgi:NADPH:quinone reductase-like Zn-dependent oxidoreductase